MPSFLDIKDSLSPIHQPFGVLSMNSSFDSSFSSDSSGSSWEMLDSPCPTPLSARRTSYDSLDYDALSAGTVSQVTTPIGNEFYPANPMIAMASNMMSDDHSYFTPCGKSMGQNLAMNFHQYGQLYNPYESQNSMHGMFFDHPSSVSIAVSPTHQTFVDPSQTLFHPQTPVRPSRILGSSPEEFSLSSGPQYFLTPTPPRSSQSSSSFDSPLSRSSIKLEEIKSGASAALHRIQSTDSRVTKHSQKRMKPRSLFNASNTNIIAAGHFRCDFPHCESKHAFKRQEHLKRHKKTHYASKDLNCQYCHKKFQEDRRDNYRSHIRLHAESKDKKGSRTKFFEAAVREVESWSRMKEEEEGDESPSVRTRARMNRV